VIAFQAWVWADVGASNDSANHCAVAGENPGIGELGDFDTVLWSPSSALRHNSCHALLVRLTEFWRRMELVFGTDYARSWAKDFSLAALGDRTVDNALASGADTKDVWRAVCEHADVPAALI